MAKPEQGMEMADLGDGRQIAELERDALELESQLKMLRLEFGK